MRAIQEPLDPVGQIHAAVEPTREFGQVMRHKLPTGGMEGSPDSAFDIAEHFVDPVERGALVSITAAAEDNVLVKVPSGIHASETG